MSNTPTARPSGSTMRDAENRPLLGGTKSGAASVVFPWRNNDAGIEALSLWREEKGGTVVSVKITWKEEKRKWLENAGCMVPREIMLLPEIKGRREEENGEEEVIGVDRSDRCRVYLRPNIRGNAHATGGCIGPLPKVSPAMLATTT